MTSESDVGNSAAGDGSSLVLQTSFLGDMVLTTPLIARLALRGPVDVVATPASAALLANNPCVRRVVVYDKRGAHVGVTGLLQIAGEIRSTGAHDVAYCVQGSLRTAALALTAGYRTRIGFETSSGRVLYTQRVAYRDDRHHTERLWSLGRAVNDARPTTEELRPRLYPGDDERAAADAALGSATAGRAHLPFVALAPGSVWETKRWPKYAELARTLTGKAIAVVVGGRDDTTLAREIIEASSGTAIDATGRLSLLASAELIGRCAVLVTNDSAPQHLASAMGTPTVTVFGPTVPDFGFGPIAPSSTTTGVTGLSCRPCDRHGPRVCPLGHWRCMRDLSVASIAHHVDALLALSPR